MRAIVIGAGVAGTLAAKVLSERASSVIVLERDQAPEAGMLRPGIPQGHHVHNLLYRGIEVFESRFPGLFGDPDSAEGCPKIEISWEQRILGPFGWNPIYHSGLHARGFTREYLDRSLARALAKVPNVELRWGVEGLGLLGDRERVCGVRTRTGDVEADLVLDASGRNSKLGAWLAEHGHPALEATVLSGAEGYASRTFAFRGELPSWRQMIVLRTPSRPRGGYLFALQGGLWVMTLVGGKEDLPPHGEAEFLAYARSLPAPAFAEMIERAEPAGPIRVYRNMDSVCRFYGRSGRWPEGLLAMGDNVSTFNPVFGQGMSVAANGAELLGRVLDGSPRELWGRNFQEGLLSLVESPWFYSTRGPLRPESVRFITSCRLAALKLLMRAMPKDRKVHFALFQIQSLMRPIGTLFRPLLLLRALFAAHFRKPAPSPTDLSLPAEGRERALRAA